MICRRYAFLFLMVAITVCWLGCNTSKTKKPANGDNNNNNDEPFVLGDLVEDFEAPTLDDLNAKAEWIDQPVLDSMKLLRDHKSKEGKPAIGFQEALALRNDSPDNNGKILSAMGQLPASEGDVDWDASILRHTAGDVKSTNPLMISSTAEFDVAGLIGGGLFGFDWNFVPFASKDSVVSWQSSKDGLYDKVVLRDDLTWSDGKPFTAHDVEFSYLVIMSKKVPVPAVRSGTDQLKAVKAYGDNTVVFFHKESLATNVWNINFPIIPKHVYEKSIEEDPTLSRSPYHVEKDKNPVTLGMYTITKRERGQEIVLARRESYYVHEGKQVRSKPHFKEIRFKIITDPTTSLLALKKGEIEELQLTPEQWQTQTGDDQYYSQNTKVYDLEWVYFYFGWNCKTPFFSDKRVRQAMSYAFNHQELLDEHRFGMDEACTGIFHHTSRWALKPAPEPYQQDLDKAEELLTAAGWEDHDGDGILDKEINGKTVPFEFTILTSQRSDRIAICNLLRENLDQLGILCNVSPMEFTVLQDRSRKHKFHAIFAGWGTGTDPDTSENLWTTKAIDQGRNYVQYSNPEIDKLFEDGKRELDPKKRPQIYARIHQVLWEDQPYTWLYFRNAYFGFNKKLRGYNFSPRGPYNYGPGFESIWKPALQ